MVERHDRRLARFRAALFAAAIAATLSFGFADLPPARELDALRHYIKQSWTTLTRSNRTLPVAARDPKMHRPPGEPSPVYVARDEDPERIAAELARILSPADLKTIQVERLPDEVAPDRQGLLYLPKPYVVPGGRFNEMYGWDSYFTNVGLLADDEVDRARDMTDNFLYEVEHYGTVLNANRTYYLTRSQPPFLTRMILDVYERTHDRAWLRRTVPAIDKYYAFWISEPHLIPEIGLSRYFDRGEGPAPEVLADERDAEGRTHYDRVREYYRTHEVTDYDKSLYYDAAADRLTALFYKGDRSMRESGFDPSNRFGPFSADIIHYAPVCLNSLLYQMEMDGARVMDELADPQAASRWRDRAAARRARMNELMWDADRGLYFDYNFTTRQRRIYEFATTFYPLWAGLATPAQAAKVRGNLARFEAPGGLLTSTQVTGNQWDAPFGWAPLQLIAVEGLRRYGFDEDADRLSAKFISLVNDDFREHGTIVEKYDVQRRRSDVAAGITFGYAANQVGFGWTNAAVVRLLEEMHVAAGR